jgi:hypothetical protein
VRDELRRRWVLRGRDANIKGGISHDDGGDVDVDLDALVR